MSYIHNNPDFSGEVQIKPKLIARIPYKFCKNGLTALDYFISMSPGLEFLKSAGALVISIHSNNTMFYTDQQWALDEYNRKFTENTAICNLVLFAEQWKNKHPEENPPAPRPQSHLQKLLNELHEDDENFDADYFDNTQNKSDVKKIIKFDRISDLIRRKRKGEW